MQPCPLPPGPWPKDEVPSACWINDRYTCWVYPARAYEGFPPVVHLSIKRNDKACVHDWRDIQRIKNDVCGPEREAVELYPAESRLMDTSNQYHLWVIPEGLRFPFGYIDRVVVNDSGSRGAVQRPFAPGDEPKDSMTSEDVDAALDELTRKGAFSGA